MGKFHKAGPDEPRYLIIPAAGLGTRMRVVNPDLPKELLPVGHKPAIQYAVDEGVSAGINNIIIIISRQKEIIRQYFEESSRVKKLFPAFSEEIIQTNEKCSFTFFYQKELSGEADAISYAGDIAAGHSVAIIYPDDIYFPAPGALAFLKSFKSYGPDIFGLINVSPDNAACYSNSGRVDVIPVKDPIYKIKRFHKKEEGNFTLRFKKELRTCGISIFGPHLFENIEKARATVREGEFTDGPVIESILMERDISGCRLPGTIYDIGNPAGYRICIEHNAKKGSIIEQ
ncbi:MAG: sugar phosphate nucleotidyltransferase [Nitrospirota bacterium]